MSRRLPRFVFRYGMSYALMLSGALLMFAVSVLTLNRARRFNSEVIAKRTALGVLHIWGLRLRVHSSHRLPETQTVYISNHTSSLDVPILVALGLPKTRFFLKGYVRKHLPIGIASTLMGTFFTVPQEYPEERRKIFRNACEELQRTGESVYLSPEGKITLTGKVGPFNKGAFHLATNLKATILPMYIQIPPESDSRDGFFVPQGGVVEVFLLDPISTSEWRLEDLETNRDRVRNILVDFETQRKGIRV